MRRLFASSLLLSLLAAGPSLAGGIGAGGDPGDADRHPPSGEWATGASSPVAAPRWQALAAAEDNGYRVSLARGALDLGVRFEARAGALRPMDGRYDSASPMGTTLPSLSVGLRNVGAAAAPAPADTLLERALGAQEESAASSKVGVEWKPAQSRVFFHQGVGVRLAGDDRLVMRMKKGSLGLFMHAAF